MEFRRDVVAVARKGEAPLTQIARDFGISQSDPDFEAADEACQDVMFGAGEGSE